MSIVTQVLESTTAPHEAITFGNLSLFPLVQPSAATLPAPAYLTLDEALARGTARITEVSEGGSVPELQLINTGDLPVLLMDGEELRGAKQNRTVNVSILAPARATLLIPVTCVEAGRWSHTSDAFAAAPHAHFAAGRAQKSAQVTAGMKRGGRYQADQGAVWEEIDAKAARMGAASPTRAMSDVYEQHAGGVESYVRALTARLLPDQVGALFALGGRVVGMDRFDHPATLARLLPKIIRSHALDALDAGSAYEGDTLSRDGALAFLGAVAKAGAEAYPAIGLGKNVRLSGPRVNGGALVNDAFVVHLSAFRREDRPAESAPPPPATATRANARQTLFQRAASRLRSR